MSKKSNLAKSSALALGLISAAAGNASAQERVHARANPGGFFEANATHENVDLKAGFYYDVFPGFSVMPYGSYNVPYSTKDDVSTVITQRERELIGPGTYKFREDSETARTNTRYDFGAGLMIGSEFLPGTRLGLGLSLVRKIEESEVSGESNIWFVRNDVEIGRGSIENMIPRTKETKYVGSLYASVTKDINPHIALGAFYQYLDETNKGGAVLRINQDFLGEHLF